MSAILRVMGTGEEQQFQRYHRGFVKMKESSVISFVGVPVVDLW